MTGTDVASHRQQDLYWKELFQLKIACEYLRRYRSILARWVTVFDALKAFTSSGAIGGWVIWKEYAFFCGAMIAVSQVADALTDVFPFTARLKAANELVMNLDALFIEVLHEWEGVFAARFTNAEITERRRKLMQLRHDLEVKHFPNGGLPKRDDLLTLAEKDTIAYLEAMFGEANGQ
jgi:hypothetical protein